ncbi:MAG TPA: SEC-C metal-binding domain-containing protein [Bacteroidota bacterium]|nr:SEC-C metal-binding domain-containing protein [Bacteroidota bacterium]
MKINPNDPCPCGSKKKYRDCCKRKKDRNRIAYFVIGVIITIVIAKLAFTNGTTAPPGKVWSPEHGHWHDVTGNELPSPVGATPQPQTTTTNPQAGTPSQQPPGPPPPGKVWSAEHGHWHNISGTNTLQNIPQPAGPVPEGKVWSPEHGHWHDKPKQ